MKIKFGVVDVTTGRKALAAEIEKRGKIPVVIYASIGKPVSGDDGASVEFEIEVHGVHRVDQSIPSK